MKPLILFAYFCLLVSVGSSSCADPANDLTTVAAASPTPFTPGESDNVFDGKRVERSEKEWKRLLSKDEFYILRKKGTEQPFTGKYDKNYAEGDYHCAGCGLKLFQSKTKFDSGTGWPSFYQPVDKRNVTDIEDLSYGMVRTEVVCSRCGGHLGHVFNDGPEPTGLRYCINSAALKFVGSTN